MPLFSIFRNNTDKIPTSKYEQMKSKLEAALKDKQDTIDELSNKIEDARIKQEEYLSLIERMSKSMDDEEKCRKELIDAYDKLTNDYSILMKEREELVISHIEQEKSNDSFYKIKYEELLSEFNNLIEKNNGLSIKLERLSKTKTQKGYEINRNNDPTTIKQEIKNGIKVFSPDYSIELIEINLNEKSRCLSICDKTTCSYVEEELSFSQDTYFEAAHVSFIIENLSNEDFRLYERDFTVIDNHGFSYKGLSICDKYSLIKKYKSGSFDLPPKSKVKYEVIFALEKCDKISAICYGNYKSSIRIDLDSIDKGEEYDKFESLRNELEKEREEKEHISNFRGQGIKYITQEDDDYFYVISKEDSATISFNREFDKTKDNYNWINVNDPLITLREDDVPYVMQNRTLVMSPVSGIFEFQKNKVISCDEVICKIRKYPQNKKQDILLELEREEIKQSIYKKERKKMIERETLDELISEGKVFNVYTKKDGNRTTIPMEIANAVWNRDGGKCCNCGSRENLEFDHIIPLAKGGATSFRNLQLLCQKCNRIKSDNI